MRVPKVLFFLVTAVSLACAQTASKANSQAPLDRGVAATADAIHQLDRVIAQNEEDLSKLFAEQGFKFMKAAGGEGLDWIKPLESGYTGFQAGKDLNAGRYAEALSEAAKVIADVWGELDPNVKLGKAGVEVAADVYEAQSLLRQQAQLLGMRLQLEKQYYRLKGKSGLDLTQIDKIQAALDEDAKLHEKFLESLKKYSLNQQDVKSKALKNASARPGRGYQVASGMIVDPQSDVDSLAKIPGINPDFIASLRKQFELLQRGDLESVELAGAINKYDYNTPNWSYINVFGPGRGTAAHPTLSVGSDNAPVGVSAARNAKIQTKQDTDWGGGRINVKFHRPPSERNKPSPSVLLYCDPVTHPCAWTNGCGESCYFDVSELPVGTTGLTLGVCLDGTVQDWRSGDAFAETRAAKAEGRWCIMPHYSAYRKPDLTYQLPIPKRPKSVYVEIDTSVLPPN